MKKFLLALALVGVLTPALAQPVVQNQVTGNECWNAGQGPGGPSAFLCLFIIRGGATNLPMTIAGSFTIGSVAAQSQLVAGGNMIVTAQPSAATITMQPNPVVDGAIIGYCNVTSGAFATNVVTLVANSNQTMNTAVTVTTQAAGSCARVQWNQANATWYRIQ